ncbi:MAG: tRNA 2-thiocytidine(32) synthetase TtcA [Firmicutes bacterium]|nr:tRNA 2-thiocytidine(32) synthetase TtcA [Bacillota bacterium]
MSEEQHASAAEKIIRRQVGRAIADYRMIKDGDHIMLGLSGGKDSLVLLLMLNRLSKIAPVKFSLSVATLDQGFGSDFSRLESFCASLSVPYHIHSVNLARIVFETRSESNPCALCSHLRRGALNNLAKKLGCSKIAYAHHADDAVETLLLNMFYTGQVASFSPVTHLSRQDLEVIRPLVYVRELSIVQLAEELKLPVLDTPCPAAGHTKRAQVKQIVQGLEKEIPGIHLRLMRSLQNGGRAQFWEQES